MVNLFFFFQESSTTQQAEIKYAGLLAQVYYGQVQIKWDRIVGICSDLRNLLSCDKAFKSREGTDNGYVRSRTAVRLVLPPLRRKRPFFWVEIKKESMLMN